MSLYQCSTKQVNMNTVYTLLRISYCTLLTTVCYCTDTKKKKDLSQSYAKSPCTNGNVNWAK